MIVPKISTKASVSIKESSFDPLLIECPPTDNINTAEIAMVGEAPSTQTRAFCRSSWITA